VKSQLAQKTDRDLIEASQRLSPEERLNAFLTHCRLVMELYEIALKLDAGNARNHEDQPLGRVAASAARRTRSLG
jgi:hypothetical protein